MPSPYNPARRNRNIGTAKQGLGRDNRLVIPNRRHNLHWLDRVGEHEIFDLIVAGREVRFIVEATAGGCIHACSIADVAHILVGLPASDWSGINIIVLKQPTRKQRLLSPVWGRLLYFAEVATAAGRVLGQGPAIYLDAVEVDKVMAWRTSLDPDDAAELKRLEADGHRIERVGRKYNIIITADSARRTQLYRTLPHEIGHWFDWLAKVEEPAARGLHRADLETAYFARPNHEREAFANRYAAEQRARLEEIKAIPFD